MTGSVKVLRTGSDGTLIAVEGVLDVATRDQFVAETTKVLHATAGRLVLDFSGVEFCDSTGFAALVKIRSAAATLGVAFQLINARPRIQARLKMTGLDVLLDAEEPG